MALQASGAISLANLATEFGGSTPHSLSEYYRNGGLVPSTISTVLREPTTGTYYSSATPTYSFNWSDPALGGDNSILGIGWNGVTIYDNLSLSLPIQYGSSITISGYTYYRGAYRDRLDYKGYAFSFHEVYRTSSSSITVNAGVPTSGGISFSQFYGGRKT